MFRNPVYDLMVLLPAFLAAGLVSFFIVSPDVRAQEGVVTTYTGTSTLPDPHQRRVTLTRDTVDAHATSSSVLGRVVTSTELVAYAERVLLLNEAVSAITLSSKGIRVDYSVDKKLLGMLPLTLPAAVQIESNGNVIFREPWYGGMTTGTHEYLKSALEVRTHTLLTSEGYSSSTLLSPMTQAELLDLVEELL